MISIIAAIGANNELGYENGLIWKIPDDLKRFREKTRDHAVIMGRKTYESIKSLGRPLPGKLNIVLTRDLNLKIDEAVTLDSIEKALDFAKENGGEEEIFIVGGAQIYSLSLPHANKLYLTRINSFAPLADTFFPDYSEFRNVIYSEKHNDDGLEYEFVDLEK